LCAFFLQVASKEPLLIIASDLVGEAASGLVLNKNRCVLDVCVVKAPGFGEVRRAFLEDICIFCGANFLSTELSLKLKDAGVADLGRLERVVVSKDKTLLVSSGESEEAVENRVAQIKEQIESKLKTDKEFEVQRLEQRIVKLRGAVARIKVRFPASDWGMEKLGVLCANKKQVFRWCGVCSFDGKAAVAVCVRLSGCRLGPRRRPSRRISVCATKMRSMR
jgi:hypothetical protein